MSVNCWICGKKLESDEVITMIINGRNQLVHKDEDECLYLRKENEHDMEFIEDTPCLEEPWWAYR